VAVSLGKRVSLKIKRKTSFLVSGGQSGPFGRTVRGLLVFIFTPEFLAKDFEKLRFRADGLQGPGGQSAGTRRTVREVPRTVRYS
jgi:hypothetical protein